jgi:hypothetical protein
MKDDFAIMTMYLEIVKPVEKIHSLKTAHPHGGLFLVFYISKCTRSSQLNDPYELKNQRQVE